MSIWNIPFTPTQILSHVTTTFTGFEPNLLGYYRFEETGGDAVLDLSPAHHTAFLGGGIAANKPLRTSDTGPQTFSSPQLDPDGDGVYFSAVSDNPGVSAAVLGGNLTLTPAPNFAGTAHITVTTSDGPSSLGDWRGRSSVSSFDFTAGANAIFGNTFFDANKNGAHDLGEPGVGGVTVYIDANLNGVLEPGEINTLSDANGDYHFGPLISAAKFPRIYVLRAFAPGLVAPTTKPTTFTAFGQIATSNDVALIDLIAPTGTLLNPAPSSTITTDLGYVDVKWNESGVGLNPATLGTDDITITGVDIDRVAPQGGGVYRYIYNDDGDLLPPGSINVAATAAAPVDFAGNAAVAAPLGSFTRAGSVFTGTAGNDTFLIRINNGQIEIFQNTPTSSPPTFTFQPGAFNSFSFNTLAGNDHLTIDFTGGNPIPANGIILDAGAGADTLDFTAAANVTGAVNIVGGTVNVTNDAAGLTLALSNSSVVNFTSSQHLTSLIVNDSAKATLSAGGAKFMRLSNIVVSSNATFDLTDNDLIAQSTPGGAVDLLATLNFLLFAGRNNGLWNGKGIISSTAAAEPNKLTGLAVAINDRGNGSVIRPIFDGETVDNNTLLVKYTYNGDTDFTGKIDADDYFNIDLGFAHRADPNSPDTGYHKGDFDFSGIIDADDYFLIDRAFAGQTGALAQASPSATPTARLAHHHKPAKKHK